MNSLRRFWESAGMLLVFALLFLGCSIFVEHFFTWGNILRGLLQAVATIGIISCTMLFCLAAGSFDLSVGSIVACTGVVTAVVINSTHSIVLGVGAGLGLGIVVGTLNGLLVARAGINALISTLATMQIVRGIAYIVTKGNTVGVREESFFLLGRSSVTIPAGDYVLNLPIPVPVLVCVGCFVVFGILIERTTFGRNTLAIGGNLEAARLAGIGVDRIRIMIFALQGLLSSLAGIVVAAQIQIGDPKAGEGLELEVIAACVLGGVSLTGGIGNIGYVVAGVLIMGTVSNAMSLLSVPTFYQYVVRGSVLLAAVAVDRLKQRGGR